LTYFIVIASWPSLQVGKYEANIFCKDGIKIFCIYIACIYVHIYICL
jgi:hypothetical protein